MRQANLISGIAALVLVIGSSSSLADPDIYRWVGDDGVVHFSEQPPENVEAEKVDTRADESKGVEFDADPLSADSASETGADGQPVDRAAQLREERAEARREAAEKRSETEAKCKQADALIAQLEPFPRVMTTNEQGEVVRMNDDDRLKKLGQAKDFTAANCSN